MKLYLLSCQNIEQYAQRILPLLPKQRQLAYDRSSSPLSLGAGLLLASVLDVHRDEDLAFGAYGKPALANEEIEFSLSHSGNHVLLGLSDAPIGVDMEPKRRRVIEALRERICLPQEKELDLLTVFTRKECAMKLTGLGFGLSLQDVDVTVDYAWQNRSYHFFTTEDEGYVISVLSAEKELPAIQLLTPETLL